MGHTLVALATIVLAACGPAESTVPSSATGPDPTSPQAIWTTVGRSADEVVLRVMSRSMVDVPAAPSLTLYDDGWLVSRDLDDPAVLAELDAVKLTASEMSAVVTAAVAVGLDTSDRAEASPVPATRVTFRYRGSVRVSAFVAIGTDDPRARFLAELRQRTSMPAARRIRPERIALSVTTQTGGTGPVRGWPRDVPFPRVGPCRVLTPDDELLRVLSGTPALTSWKRNGQTYRVTASPLLPDSEGC
ncbi:hypothetical protein [Kineosporia succinea]|uniref:Sporulation and spore germination protein n=1 Tax=Kineosporia succinea TaxID=84632 RepID=A0ABT9NX45_9ACTN|nr:hypothetical protein [Kineosporia succinea]MDP9824994.1 hypothetical protein [Kineosporia succinea]